MDKRVGFGTRLGAFVVDVVLIGIASLLLGGMLGAWLGGAIGGAASGGAGDAAGGAAVGAILGFVFGMAAAFPVFAFLYGLIEAVTGASPGKMLLKLKVGLEDGRRAPTSTYVARWAVKYSGSLLSAVALLPGLHMIGAVATLAGFAIFIGCFLVLGDKRQALHDLAVKTAVFRTSDLV